MRETNYNRTLLKTPRLSARFCGITIILNVMLVNAELTSAGAPIVIHPDGSLKIEAINPAGTQFLTPGQPIRYTFGLPPQRPKEQTLEKDGLPICHSSWESEGIRYTQIVLQTRLKAGDLMPAGKIPPDAVLLVRLVGECLAREYTDAHVALGIQAQEHALTLELREDLVHARTQPLPLALIDIPASASISTNGPHMQFRGSMPPATSGSMTIKIPLGQLDSPESIQQLRNLDFEEELHRVRKSSVRVLTFNLRSELP
jgi:hypothetical protein